MDNGKELFDEEFSKVEPRKFFIKLKGKERQIKFGNLALAKLERKYGSISKLDELDKEMEEKPMEMIPWLLSICMKDKEGLDDSIDGLLEALDDENISIREITELVTEAMNSAMSNLMGEKKTD